MAKEAYLSFEGSGLHFDVVTSEQTEETASPTDHSVEEGSDISDHIRQEASHVTLTVFVSNTPIRDVNNVFNGRVAGLELNIEEAAARLGATRPNRSIAPTPGSLMNAGLDAIASALNGPTQWKAVTLQFPEGDFNNVAFVLGTLLDWKERGIIGEVITPNRTYPDMAISRVTTNRTSETGDGAEMTIELRRVRIVEVGMAVLPIPAEVRANVKVNKGKQPTEEVPEGPNKSLLKAGADKARHR